MNNIRLLRLIREDIAEICGRNQYEVNTMSVHFAYIEKILKELEIKEQKNSPF